MFTWPGEKEQIRLFFLIKITKITHKTAYNTLTGSVAKNYNLNFDLFLFVPAGRRRTDQLAGKKKKRYLKFYFEKEYITIDTK